MFPSFSRLEPPTLGILFKCDTVVSEKHVQFTKVAQIDRKGFDEIFFWYPVPPPGCTSLGCIVTKTNEMPSKDSICCPKLGLVSQAGIAEDPISRSSSSKAPNCWSIWKVENQVFCHIDIHPGKPFPCHVIVWIKLICFVTGMYFPGET
jgi:vacuolar protein sorting-associated protein 13A/C